MYIQIVSQSNWLPDSVTPATGKEVEKLSFLGPFLALSVFAEDNVSLLGPTPDGMGVILLRLLPILSTHILSSGGPSGRVGKDAEFQRS